MKQVKMVMYCLVAVLTFELKGGRRIRMGIVEREDERELSVSDFRLFLIFLQVWN